MMLRWISDVPAEIVLAKEVKYCSSQVPCGSSMARCPSSAIEPISSASAPSSSAGHRFGDVDLDDPNFEQQPYDAWTAYGRAKTANVLCAVGIDKRLEGQGVRAFAVHPGGIQTELGRHLTDETLGVLVERTKAGNGPIAWKTVEQGAATTVWAATAPELDGEGGIYLEDCHIAEVVEALDVSGGVRAYAIDPERADALWELSERLTTSAG